MRSSADVGNISDDMIWKLPLKTERELLIPRDHAARVGKANTCSKKCSQAFGAPRRTENASRVWVAQRVRCVAFPLLEATYGVLTLKPCVPGISKVGR